MQLASQLDGADLPGEGRIAAAPLLHPYLVHRFHPIGGLLDLLGGEEEGVLLPAVERRGHGEAGRDGGTSVVVGWREEGKEGKKKTFAFAFAFAVAGGWEREGRAASLLVA